MLAVFDTILYIVNVKDSMCAEFETFPPKDGH